MVMQRYEGLDGLRGVAALAVVLFHVGRWIHEPWFPHGYLAVDFFFCLSGFVMAHAYEEKLANHMGLGDFTLKRLIRLWPLIVLSMLLGAAFGVAKLLQGAPGADTLSGVMLALVFGLLIVPMAWNGHDSYLDRLFPLNAPAWSLFFELLTNIAWAAVARWLSTKTLIAFAFMSGAGILVGGLNFGHIDFGANSSSFWLGFPRVFFSFTVGLLLHRAHARGKKGIRLPTWASAIVLVLIFSVPVFPAQVIYELAMVGFVFPLLILGGAAQQDDPGLAGSAWRLSGDVSYPLYALHAPLWFLFTRSLELIDIGLSPSVGIVYAGLAVVASWMALKLYDEPVRTRLNAWRRQEGVLAQAQRRRT